MYRPRCRLALALLVTTALFASVPGVLAQGGHHPSPTAERIDNLFTLIMLPALLIGGLVFVVLIDAMILFRRGRPRRHPVARFTEHRLLEVVWTVGPALVLVMIAILTLQTLQVIEYAPAEPGIDVTVIGRQWSWAFQYHHPNGTLSAEVLEELVVPINTVVRLHVVSEDVIHSFYVPAFFIKSDAVPGTTNHNWFKATATGTFVVNCAEFCGVGHSLMRARVRVFNPATESIPPSFPLGGARVTATSALAPVATTAVVHASSHEVHFLQSSASVMEVVMTNVGCPAPKPLCIFPDQIKIDLNTELNLRVWSNDSGPQGAFLHNFTFDEPFQSEAGLKVDRLPNGQFAWVNLSLAETSVPWRIDYWCGVPGHRELGMSGTLIIGAGTRRTGLAGPPELPLIQYTMFATIAMAFVLAAVYHLRSRRGGAY